MSKKSKVDKIRSYKELRVYQNAMDVAMEIYELTKSFPRDERYSLVDQYRRASRSVCSNIAESWRKRRYKAAFIAKLSDAETEACETQVWTDFSKRCKYLDEVKCNDLDDKYDHIMSQIVLMIKEPEKWIIR